MQHGCQATGCPLCLHLLIWLAANSLPCDYRNHKLTMLMSDSLGGSAKTLMFVNVSPTDHNIDESSNSLTYATRVRTIKNDISKNEASKDVMRLKRQVHFHVTVAWVLPMTAICSLPHHCLLPSCMFFCSRLSAAKLSHVVEQTLYSWSVEHLLVIMLVSHPFKHSVWVLCHSCACIAPSVKGAHVTCR